MEPRAHDRGRTPRGGRGPARARPGGDLGRSRRQDRPADGHVVRHAPRGRDARGDRRRRGRRPHRLRAAEHRRAPGRAGRLPLAAQLVPPPQASDQPDADPRPGRTGCWCASSPTRPTGTCPAAWSRSASRPGSQSAGRSHEELGLTLTAGDLLLTDWLPPWGGWDDAICLVFDGGVHDARSSTHRQAGARDPRRAVLHADAGPGARHRLHRATDRGGASRWGRRRCGVHRIRQLTPSTDDPCPNRHDEGKMLVMSHWVFDFAEGDKSKKDLLGGKGANLAEMSNLGLPVPPGFTITTEACRAYLQQGSEPDGLSAEVDEHLAKLEQAMGTHARRRRRPAAGQRPLGRGVLDARDDGDGPQHRPQRRVRRRPRARRARTSGSRWTPTAGCCRCSAAPSSASTASTSPTRSTRPRTPRASPTTSTSTSTTCKALIETFKGLIREHADDRVPAGPARADGPGGPRRLRLVEHRPRRPLPPPGAHPRGPRHRRQHPGHGLRQPRHDQRLRRLLHPRPGLRRPGRVRRLPPERPGRGRGGGDPQHGVAGRHGRHRQAVARRAAGDHVHARAPLPRHVRHRVHRRAGQALDAADPGREAHPRGGVPDRGAHGRRGPHRHGRGAAPGQRRAAGQPDVPAVRREGRARTCSPSA